MLTDVPAAFSKNGLERDLDRDWETHVDVVDEMQAGARDGGGPGMPARQLVADSWRRSLLYGLGRDRIRQRQDEVDTDSRFVAAVKPVLESLPSRLGGSDTSVVITDPRGRITMVWAENPEHRRMLDRNLVCVGFDHSEQAIGTNGIGTALETEHSVEIIGPEHFAEQMRGFACFAAPTRHPLTRRVAGAVNITSDAAHSSPLMRSVLNALVSDMERLVLEDLTETEHSLLRQFLQERRHGQRPVVTVGEDFMIANGAAARLGLSQGLLWQSVLEQGSTSDAQIEFAVPGQEDIWTTCRTITQSGIKVGAVLVLRDQDERRRTTNRQATPTPAGLHDVARKMLETHARLLVMGEIGVGKLHAALSAAGHRPGPVDVFDPALAEVEGPSRWLERLQRRLGATTGTVVIRHVDAMPMELKDQLVAVLTARALGAPALAATAGPDGVPAEVLEVFGPSRLVVPALRQRRAEIPTLLAELCQVGPAQAPVRFAPSAVEMLQQYEWPGNVREFVDVVRAIVAEAPPGCVVGPSRIPLRARVGGQRHLSLLEEAEGTVIQQVLEECNWNKSHAAARLEISRGSLYNKMRRYRITGH